MIAARRVAGTKLSARTGKKGLEEEFCSPELSDSSATAEFHLSNYLPNKPRQIFIPINIAYIINKIIPSRRSIFFPL